MRVIVTQFVENVSFPSPFVTKASNCETKILFRNMMMKNEFMSFHSYTGGKRVNKIMFDKGFREIIVFKIVIKMSRTLF